MRAVGAAVGLVLAGCLEAPPQAVGESYLQRLTIPAGQVSEPLADFPVLVRMVADPDLAAHAASDGLDLMFVGPGAWTGSTAAGGLTVGVEGEVEPVAGHLGSGSGSPAAATTSISAVICRPRWTPARSSR